MSSVVLNSPCLGQNQRVTKDLEINHLWPAQKAGHIFDMETMQILLLAIAAALLGFALWRKIQKSNAQQNQFKTRLFSDVISVFKNPELTSGAAIGSQCLNGNYRGNGFQLQTITDTLAVRKLPCLWLQITLPCKISVTAKLDMMMRPAGQTSFSNFDFLSNVIKTPSGFPQFAQLRSDETTGYADLDIVKRHLSLFAITKFKELLITPHGLRFVFQAAEADRAYYGVLRNARFEGTPIDTQIVRQAMDALLALKLDLEEHQR
jgi:hypothetical protein